MVQSEIYQDVDSGSQECHLSCPCPQWTPGASICTIVHAHSIYWMNKWLKPLWMSLKASLVFLCICFSFVFFFNIFYFLVCFCYCRSVTKLCSTLCGPMDCSTPGFPVYHHFPELAQTHVHRVSDAVQPSLPLSPASPPALSLPQHQGLFQWVGSSHKEAKVLKLQLLIGASASVLPVNM